jgi:phage shock protein A
MSNRVEDLERQVAELQAAVNGLTEELVETKERVRQLEADHEAQAVEAERRTASDDHAEVVEQGPTDDETAAADEAETGQTTAQQPASNDTQATDNNGFIIASADGVGPESTVSDGDGSSETTESGDGDRESESDTSSSDIIVA